MLEKSYIFGPLILITLFIVLLILTLGVKALCLSVRSYFFTQPIQQEVKPKRKYSKPKPKQPSMIRSIEINPEEIDRIYVKR